MTEVEQPADVVTGELAQIEVDEVMPTSVDHVWKALNSSEGSQALFGPGVRLGDKGHSWHSENGTYGVVRSWHPIEQLRLTWHESTDAPRTMLDLHLVPQDGQTLLRFAHQRINADRAEEYAKRWTEALANFKTVL